MTGVPAGVIAIDGKASRRSYQKATANILAMSERRVIGSPILLKAKVVHCQVLYAEAEFSRQIPYLERVLPLQPRRQRALLGALVFRKAPDQTSGKA